MTLFGDINHLDSDQICSGNNLFQVVTKPTRGNAILDKIITNLDHYLKELEIYSPIGKSDHSCVLWCPVDTLPKSNGTRSRTVRPLRDSNIWEFGRWITDCDWPEMYEQQTGARKKRDAFYEIIYITNGYRSVLFN